jgi:septum formation topological specificity factor MinE
LVEEKSNLVNEKTSTPVITEEREEVNSSIVLTQDIFDEQLESIRRFFKSQEKNMELAILEHPIQIRGGEIILEVIGHVQEEIANKMRPELLRLVREYTGVNKVSVQLELKEEIANAKPKLYTSSDKLNHLKQLHPALAEFQRKFGLDVDY